MVLTLLLKIYTCFSTSSAENIITEIVTKEESLDSLRSMLWCPTFQIGTQCPENSLIFFYKCCGHLHKECCSHLRVWVLVLIIALPLLCIVPPFVYLLRRLFFKGQQRYSAGIQMTPHEPREGRSLMKNPTIASS